MMRFCHLAAKTALVMSAATLSNAFSPSTKSALGIGLKRAYSSTQREAFLTIFTSTRSSNLKV